MCVSVRFPHEQLKIRNSVFIFASASREAHSSFSIGVVEGTETTDLELTFCGTYSLNSVNHAACSQNGKGSDLCSRALKFYTVGSTMSTKTYTFPEL